MMFTNKTREGGASLGDSVVTVSWRCVENCMVSEFERIVKGCDE